MLYTLLITVFVLGVLIFVHELGHFLAAKLVNVQVLRFSIGLGKPLLSWEWGETEYSLSWIPFGGYVKMAGDDPAEGLESEVDEEKISTDPERMFENKGVLQRILVIVAGPAANFLLAVFVFQAVFFLQGAETYPTTVIETVEKQYGGELAGRIADGSRVLEVDGEAVNDWDELMEGLLAPADNGRKTLLLEKPSGDRYTVEVPAAGDSVRQYLAASLVPRTEARIGSLIPGKPAQQAGLERGDLIVGINGEDVDSWYEMTSIIHNSGGSELELVVRRGDERRTYELQPEVTKIPQGDGSFIERGLIGIKPRLERKRLGLAESIASGARKAVYMTTFIVKSLSNLFVGLLSRDITFGEAGDVFGGPVLIGQMAGESARAGQLWNFIALISINLMILNLLPIPVLDGGHLVFILIEVLRFGKPLSAEQRIRFIQVGLVIIIGLMVLATANDFRRLLGF